MNRKHKILLTKRRHPMPKISKDGVEKLDHIKNGIDRLYDLMESKNVLDEDAIEVFRFISEIVSDAKTWARAE